MLEANTADELLRLATLIWHASWRFPATIKDRSDVQGEMDKSQRDYILRRN